MLGRRAGAAWSLLGCCLGDAWRRKCVRTPFVPLMLPTNVIFMPLVLIMPLALFMPFALSMPFALLIPLVSFMPFVLFMPFV
eukprot:7628119-Lingulodinium_polyedra.AAC.1